MILNHWVEALRDCIVQQGRTGIDVLGVEESNDLA